MPTPDQLDLPIGYSSASMPTPAAYTVDHRCILPGKLPEVLLRRLSNTVLDSGSTSLQCACAKQSQEGQQNNLCLCSTANYTKVGTTQYCTHTLGTSWTNVDVDEFLSESITAAGGGGFKRAEGDDQL